MDKEWKEGVGWRFGEKKSEEKLLFLQVTMVMAGGDCSGEGKNSCQIRAMRIGGL